MSNSWLHTNAKTEIYIVREALFDWMDGLGKTALSVEPRAILELQLKTLGYQPKFTQISGVPRLLQGVRRSTYCAKNLTPVNVDRYKIVGGEGHLWIQVNVNQVPELVEEITNGSKLTDRWPGVWVGLHLIAQALSLVDAHLIPVPFLGKMDKSDANVIYPLVDVNQRKNRKAFPEISEPLRPD